MSIEEQDIALQDGEYGIDLSSDQVNSLFVPEEEEAPKFESAPEPTVENSEETATTETATQETEQPSEDESVSTEDVNEQDLVFVHNDIEYSDDDITLAIEALQNKEEWQKSNTQKAQEVAEERKKLDSLMSRVSKVVESDDLKEYLGADHDLFKSVSEYEGLPKGAEETIEQPKADDRVALLEEKIMSMQAERQVDEDIANLIVAHPELQGSTEALNDVLEVALNKNLNLEDAYVFAMASSNGETALKKAIKSVEEANALKAQPEVKPSGRGNTNEPVPVGNTWDEIEEIALSRYNIMK